MEKRWNILNVEQEKINALQQQLKINSILCRLLVLRGIETFDQAKQFFRPDLSCLHSPWLMKDMNKAVHRITAAFQDKEKILVFGDYDVDGTTSVACMYQFLQGVYDEALLGYYVPQRYREGYGISKMGIDYAKTNGFSLIISLDCGIKSIDLIAYAKSLAIDFIVCDHHLPDLELPEAVAILNPKQPDCAYPYKDLCGCGVGYKLITALCEHLGLKNEEAHRYLDLVATAIAADIVPMTGENRILAYYGLKKINEDPCVGIKALMQLSGLQKKLNISSVVFVIAPRVNAAGRMDDAGKAVQLFIANDFTKALTFAEMLHADNSDRKEADSSITEQALAMIASKHGGTTRNSTVVFQPHWHKGVVGIVASRLIEKYYRPTIVLTQSGEIVAGSARSVHGFNLYEAIHACREHLIGYGGHFAAAGMTLLPAQVDAFINKFEEVVTSTIPPELLIPEIPVDSEVFFKDIRPSFYNIISQMEPFGPGNLRPIFIAKNLLDYGWSKIVKEQHVRFVLQQQNIIFSGIGFNMADRFHLIKVNTPIDVLFTLEENEWNNQMHLQLKVIDFRISET